MNNAGFYKLDQDEILYAPNYVEGFGYSLTMESKHEYTFPVDGWIYADSHEDAVAYFASQQN